MMMSRSSGVCDRSVVVRSARYWMYCDVPVKGPGTVTGVNAVHEPSGVGVLPVRTLMVRLVPAGLKSCHVTVFQFTGACASKTRETNDPVAAAYGFMRIQSTTTLPPKGL